MASSLSNLVNNLCEGIHKIKYKYGHDDKIYETCGIKHKYCDCFLECINFKDDLIKYKCLCCNNNYEQKLYEKFKKRFFNTYRFSKHDNNKLYKTQENKKLKRHIINIEKIYELENQRSFNCGQNYCL